MSACPLLLWTINIYEKKRIHFFLFYETLIVSISKTFLDKPAPVSVCRLALCPVLDRLFRKTWQVGWSVFTYRSILTYLSVLTYWTMLSDWSALTYWSFFTDWRVNSQSLNSETKRTLESIVSRIILLKDGLIFEG